ncbi:hypothetical protein FNF31_05347 [Cafeteria roenbergensis]|uniref:NAD-dependent epimerase/dehydratase domain-containing protein n=1 Tax=Cafeteria roenbergensis TaxID=33653 RepID=A0A5A8E139_CAFRO|nr:hypothetical protein FNF31_05347 [Cafeteria roenbergensis]KAA0171068.1 hypothetical protein FNF28_01073 [Cafeteria roenbergensis]
MAAAAGSSADSKVVCVTGASGYVASQLVAALLAKGCTVHGTVRSVANPAKTAHLKALPGAADRLKLFEADLLKAGSFDEALAGCSECHHTASPFFNDGVTDAELQLIRPAVEGTLNVLGSCKKNGVRTIVVTSSTAAVYGRREGNPAGHVITEAQWADEDLAAENKVHYVVSKIKAERAVWAFAEKEFPEARIVAVNPTLVVGPMLQPVMNTSSAVIAGFLSGEQTAVPSGYITIVDVRDVVAAHIAAAERDSASGRYLLVGGVAKWADLVASMREATPSELAGKLPSEIADPAAEAPWRYNMKSTLTVDCSKATKDLGIEFRSPATSVRDLCADSVFQSLVKPVTA